MIAGAGSGKTRVIVEKIARLVDDIGHAPERIVGITFTNKAAREMRARLAKRLGRDAALALRISTFHALGLRLLRSESAALGFAKPPTLLDPGDVAAVLKPLLPAHLGADALKRTQQAISHARNRQWSAEQLREHDRIAADAMPKLAQRLNELAALDFDDLLIRPLALLRADPALRLRWQLGIAHLLVDEVQDTNAVQFDLLHALLPDHAPLTAVGDDDQSIYAFRGAQPENLARLGALYPRLKVIALEHNYRSDATILKAANALIALNPHIYPKQLKAVRDSGQRLLVLAAADGHDEAERVVADLSLRLAGPQPPATVALLYRSNHQARVFEQALRGRGIGYRLSGGQSFFERQEVRDAIGYLRLIADPDDDAAFLRIVDRPSREVGERSIEVLLAVKAQMRTSLLKAAAAATSRLQPRAQRSLSTLTAQLAHARSQLKRGAGVMLRQLLSAVGYLDWLQSQSSSADQAAYRARVLDEFYDWLEQKVARDGAALAALIDELGLGAPAEADDEAPVRLMTLHAAKGLEFDCVYLVGLEEGTMPSQNALDEGTIEEERRLMYVGITRARRQLVLSWARTRSRFGQTERMKRSRFMDELPETVLHIAGADPAADAARRQQAASTALAALQAQFASRAGPR